MPNTAKRNEYMKLLMRRKRAKEKALVAKAEQAFDPNYNSSPDELQNFMKKRVKNFDKVSISGKKISFEETLRLIEREGKDVTIDEDGKIHVPSEEPQYESKPKSSMLGANCWGGEIEPKEPRKKTLQEMLDEMDFRC